MIAVRSYLFGSYLLCEVTFSDDVLAVVHVSEYWGVYDLTTVTTTTTTTPQISDLIG